MSDSQEALRASNVSLSNPNRCLNVVIPYNSLQKLVLVPGHTELADRWLMKVVRNLSVV